MAMMSVRPGLIAIWLLLVSPAAPHGQAADESLEARIAEAVAAHPDFTIFDDVHVSVSGRVATLRGRVTTWTKRDGLERTAAAVDGVTGLRNEIRVLPDDPADVALRTRVALAIYRHPAFWRHAQQPDPPIHIIIEHQHITLTGEVESEVDRMLAASLARVSGAASVTNDLTISARR